MIVQVNVVPSWINPFISNLHDGVLHDDRDQVRSLRLHAARYLLENNILYKRGINAPILRCLQEDEVNQVLIKVHEGGCNNHSRGQALAHKVIRMGYYWPKTQQDSTDFA